MLNDKERQMVESFAKQIDLHNTNGILQYGAGTQKKMADALLRLRRHHQTAIILVTHDIRLAAYMADTLLILRQGHVEEYGPAAGIMAHPGAAYTEHLLTLAGMRKEASPCSSK